jgi:serine protease Do
MQVLQQLNTDIAAVAEGVQHSLVRVYNGRGAGAGIILHQDGLIVTNAHVVAHASRRRGHIRPATAPHITLADGRSLPARILASDPERDLAALAVEAADLPTIQLGDSKSLRPGQWVMAMGYPWGLVGAATAGVVIGAGTAWPEMPPSGKEWVVVSLHLRPGDSGGPLVDLQGQVVGINTMMNGPDVGVAVPASVVKQFLGKVLKA